MKQTIVEKQNAAKEKAQEIANFLNYFGEGDVKYRFESFPRSEMKTDKYYMYHSRELRVVRGDMWFQEVELFVVFEKPSNKSPFKVICPVSKNYQRVKTHAARKEAIQEALGLKGEVVEYLCHHTGTRRIQVIAGDTMIAAYQSKEEYLDSCI